MKEFNSELEICPLCNANWKQSDIADHFESTGCSREEAEEKASHYGWTKENKLFFSRLIGIEIEGGYDGISEWMCPDCESKWDRFTNKLIVNGNA